MCHERRVGRLVVGVLVDAGRPQVVCVPHKNLPRMVVTRVVGAPAATRIHQQRHAMHAVPNGAASGFEMCFAPAACVNVTVSAV